MANENLKNALIAAGMTPEEFADTIQVDPRTVERWVAGRTPYRRHRATISRALDIPQRELWPEETPPAESTAADGQDPAASHSDDGSVASVPHRDAGANEVDATWGRSNAPGTPNASSFLEGAWKRIDLLDGGMNLIGNHGLIDTLRAHATTGTTVRVIVNAAAPDLHALTGQERVEVRVRDARTAHVLLRADDQALLGLRLESGGIPPLLKLTRRHEDGLFDRLTEHFDTWWQHSQPLPATSSEPPAGERTGRRWPGRES